ncbi:MAG: hypothetical protein IT432_06030 [Phycisphaerales bacterium]|nr:hypothetical protein [Phycisphaerales bacterium]
MSASARRPSIARSVRAPAAMRGTITLAWILSRRALLASRPELVDNLRSGNGASVNPELHWRLDAPGQENGWTASADLVLPNGTRLPLFDAPARDVEWIELEDRDGARHVEVRVRGGKDLVAVLAMSSDVTVRYAITPVLGEHLNLAGGCYEPPTGRWDVAE